MKYFITYAWFFISYASCLDKSSTETVPHEVKNLFQNVTLPPVENVINKTGKFWLDFFTISLNGITD